MTSPIEIPHVHSSSQDAGFDDDESNRFKSTSYGSNCTDLSITSRNVVVADRWTVSGKIGEGSFGEVFKVRDVNTNQCYAIKRENTKTKHSQLKYESAMYDVLSGGVGIPRCYWHGNFDGFECIVMDFLGPNLAQVRQNVSDVELEVAIDLVCQMVSIVEDIHNRGVVVRDIKPDNFLFSSKHQLPETEMIETIDEFGMPVISYKKQTCKEVFTEQWQDRCPKLYAVDFGLACYWRDPDTGKIYPDTKKHTRNKTGTARYASINVHRGRTHSRRDDVESIGYILLDLLMGTLPWTGIHARNSKAGWDRMRQLKVDTFMADLCAGLPNGVLKFIEHPRKLQFGDQPDYEKMRQYLLGALPGGDYADLVKSPFGGGITSTDNYDTIQQEQRLLAERQLQQEQHILDQYNQKMQADANDHSNETAIEHDDTTQHLFNKTAVSGATKGGKDYSLATTAKRKGSQSSIQKLLNENMAKTVGWNTYKHDQAPWNPKTNWTNDDIEQATGSKPTRSWGDDNDQELGTWGDSLTTTTTTQPDDQQVVLAASSSWGNDKNVDQGKWNEQPPWAETQQQGKKKSAAAAMSTTTWGEQPSWDPNNHSTTLPMATVTEATWGERPSWDDSNHIAALPTKQQRGRKKSSNNQKPTRSEQQSSWGARPPWEDIASPLSPHSKKMTTEPKRGASWRTTGQHDKQELESSASKQRDQASSSWRTVRTEQQPPPRSRKPNWQKSNSDTPSSTWESKQDHTLGWSTTTNDIDYDNVDQQWNEKANSSWIAAKGDGWQQRKKQPGSNSWQQQKRRPLAK